MQHFMLTMALLCAVPLMGADTVTLFDFTDGKTHGYIGNPQVKSVTPSPEGLVVVCKDDEDPWIEGPGSDLWPQGDFEQMYMDITFKGHGSDTVEVFYGPGFTANNSFIVKSSNDSKWQTRRAMLPKQPLGSRVRIDPTNKGGGITVASIKVTPIPTLYHFKATPPKVIEVPRNAPQIASGKLVIKHDASIWDAFVIEYDGERLACGHSDSEIAFLENEDKASSISLPSGQGQVTVENNALIASCSYEDVLGGTWTLTRSFTPLPNESIQVTTTVIVNEKRQVGHIPWMTLFPGLGSFGQEKRQAVLPGVEYLQNEPSSNELDVRGRGANRLSVASYKLCFPLMAIVSPSNTWLSLSWKYDDYPATIFDTPDRQFNSGASLFALWSPGTHNGGRLENALNVYDPTTFEANEAHSMTQIVSAGHAGSVVPAIKRYLEQHPLPELPTYKGGFQAAVNLMAHGWLDSKSYVEGKWRHAVWGKSFGPTFSTDALQMLNWIACTTQDKELSQRTLDRLKDERIHLDEYESGQRLPHGIGHGYEALYGYLYFNQVEKWLKDRSQNELKVLAGVRPDGTMPYSSKGRYGETHWTDHANGLTADHLLNRARSVLACGNETLRKEFLAVLDKVLATYKDDAPRGAQTWEVPLHTPDILGAAYMLDLCTAAYAVSGEQRYLDEAEYWACTGIPFIYLVDPAFEHGPVGRYATIAVIGATNWVAPYWIGQPVQWCGLVYRNSLLFYSKLLKDTKQKNFWNQIASGITITGLLESWPDTDEDRQGLLPDFYHLNDQSSDGPAINPTTVSIGLPEAYGQPAIFGKYPLHKGSVIHLLGAASDIQGDASAFSAKLSLWPAVPTQVLVSGIDTDKVTFSWNGLVVKHIWDAENKSAILSLQGEGRLSYVRTDSRGKLHQIFK